MKTKSYICFLVFIYFATLSSAWGVTYYVRPAGSGYGIGTGLSFDDAFAGLAAVNTLVRRGAFVAGDTIYVCGTFINENMDLESLTGISGNLITIRGDYAGHPGKIQTNFRYAIRLNNTSYVRLYSLELEQTEFSSGYGISGLNDGVNDHVIMDTINSHGWHSGIMLGYTNHEVLNCELWGNSYNGIHVSRGDGTLIHHNYIHDNGTVDKNGDGIYIDAGYSNNGEFWVYSNTVLNQLGTGGAALIDSPNGSGNTQIGHIYNNILRNCPAGYGIGLGGLSLATDDDTYYVYGNEIYQAYWMLTTRDRGMFYFYNNTVVRETVAGEGLYPLFVYSGNAAGSRHLFFRNNIFAGSSALAVKWNSFSGVNSIDSDNNNWYITTTTTFAELTGSAQIWEEWVATPHDSHSSSSDPLFINRLSADFRLKSGSPAIDTGTNTCSTVVNAKDIDGNSICISGVFAGSGTNLDMGCHEYIPLASPTGLSIMYTR
jgi:hypothetical protein